MTENRGKVISSAYDLIHRVYREIDRMSDEVREVLAEYAFSVVDQGQYSYGPKSLFLKANHTYLFSNESADSEADAREVFVMIVVFDDSDPYGVKRVSLRDQPEVWFASLKVKNRKEELDIWETCCILKDENRKDFADGDLRVGGEVFEYRWVDDKAVGDKREEWTGRLVGYPLTEMTDREAVKTKVFERLFGSSVR
jgi:hypothetical protein